MTMNQESDNNHAFNEAFGELLKEPIKPEHTPPSPDTEETLQDILFDSHEPESTATSEEESLSFDEYLGPDKAIANDYEEFASRPPLPPMNRAQEARAVANGLEEIRYTKEHMLYNYRAMTNEYTRVYSTFPLLLAKDFDEIFGKAHNEIIATLDDIEHLIAGDYDNIEAIKNDFTLVQVYEEKRMSVLYSILDFYNRKK